MINTNLNYILMGSCGAGKNTVMEYLKDAGCYPIAATDLLRAAMQEKNPRGALIRHCGETADPIPDEVVFSIVEPSLKAQIDRGFVMESFPYNLAQWSYLKNWLLAQGKQSIKKVIIIYLKTKRETILERLKGRLTCPQCSRVFHSTYHLPQKEGICDRCQGTLIIRDWDNPATIQKRFDRFEKETKPVLAELVRLGYPLLTIDGNLLWTANGFSEELNRQLRDLFL